MRARRLSPSVLADDRLSGLSPVCVVLLVVARLCCDSNGNAPATSSWWKSQSLSLARVVPMALRHGILALVQVGLLALYRVRSVEFVHVQGFREDGGRSRAEYPYPEDQAALLELRARRTLDALGPDAAKLVAHFCDHSKRRVSPLTIPSSGDDPGDPEKTLRVLSPVETRKRSVSPAPGARASEGTMGRDELRELTSLGMYRMVAVAVQRSCRAALDCRSVGPSEVARRYAEFWELKVVRRRGGAPDNVSAYVRVAFPRWVNEHYDEWRC